MDKWLKFTTEYNHVDDTLILQLTEYTQSQNVKWPTTRLVDSRVIKLKWMKFFGLSLPKKLNVLMYRMLNRYHTNTPFVAQLERMCNKHTGGKYIIRDFKTTKFIDKFKKI